jgi:hypothetical protein
MNPCPNLAINKDVYLFIKKKKKKKKKGNLKKKKFKKKTSKINVKYCIYRY